MSIWKSAVACAALLALMFLPSTASAQTCRGAIDSLNFGTINLSNNTVFDTSASVRVSCSGTAGQTVRVCPNIAAGSGGQDGSGDPRYMTNSGNQLQYNIFQDAGHTSLWGTYAGPGSSPPIDIALDASGTGQASIPIYGRIYSGQTGLPALNYTSTFSGAESYFAYSYGTAQSCAAIGTAHQTAAPFAAAANESKSCTISVTGLDFGSFADTQTARNGSTTLSIQCSSGTDYEIGLNGGLTGASDPEQRMMLHGADQLQYGLYRDASRTLPWGETAGSDTVSGTGDGNSHQIAVYGRVPIQTAPPPATYRDYVIATVTY